MLMGSFLDASLSSETLTIDFVSLKPIIGLFLSWIPIVGVFMDLSFLLMNYSASSFKS